MEEETDKGVALVLVLPPPRGVREVHREPNLPKNPLLLLLTPLPVPVGCDVGVSGCNVGCCCDENMLGVLNPAAALVLVLVVLLVVVVVVVVVVVGSVSPRDVELQPRTGVVGTITGCTAALEDAPGLNGPDDCESMLRTGPQPYRITTKNR